MDHLEVYNRQLKQVDELIEKNGETPEALRLKQEVMAHISRLQNGVVEEEVQILKEAEVPGFHEMKKTIDTKLMAEIAAGKVYTTESGFKVPLSLKHVKGDSQQTKENKTKRAREIKSLQRLENRDKETCKKANNWQSFLKKATKKKAIAPPKSYPYNKFSN